MWSFNKQPKFPYANPERLADVMALIQVLALHKYGDRSDKGLSDTMQASPRSASTWEEVAKEHPEFFRVNPGARLSVSLVSRYVLPKDEEKRRELSPDFISILLKSAIALHDRQLSRAQWWKTFLPIIGAVIAAIVSLICAIIYVVASNA